jgi:hypothetical protein
MLRARISLAALALALAGCAVVSHTASAAPTPCAYAGGYPGDAAPKIQLAAWMAAGAIRSGLPAELPVMAALPESELQNLPYGQDDSVGFFQMKLHLWNTGQYAGYLENPELQMKWFVDQALEVNRSRIADGQVPYGADPSQWGVWAADVEVPAEHARGQYQPRLEEAHGLIVAGCGLPPGSGLGPGAKADSTPPRIRVRRRRVQNPLRHGSIVVEAACPAEACVAGARGSVALRGAAKVYRIHSAPRQIPSGGKAKLRLRVTPSLRRALKRALRRGRRLRSRVVVTASDSAGNARSKRRTVTLVRR